MNLRHVNSFGGTKRTAVSFAAEKGHLEMVKLLVQHGADLQIADDKGQRAIEFAATHNHDQIVAYLESIQK